MHYVQNLFDPLHALHIGDQITEYSLVRLPNNVEVPHAASRFWIS